VSSSEERWSASRTSAWQHWCVDDLLTAKGDRRVSVVIPARDEATTISAIIAGIRADFVAATP
jgi:glucosyl-3-phosphoglycerate synthase